MSNINKRGKKRKIISKWLNVRSFDEDEKKIKKRVRIRRMGL